MLSGLVGKQMCLKLFHTTTHRLDEKLAIIERGESCKCLNMLLTVHSFRQSLLEDTQKSDRGSCAQTENFKKKFKPFLLSHLRTAD